MSNIFARRSNWFSGEMTPAAVNNDLQNLRNILGNLNNGTQAWDNVNSDNFQKGGFTGIIPLQIIQGTSTTPKSTTSTSFVDTNLTASITPQSASSKILIMAMGEMRTDTTGGASFAVLARGGTPITNGMARNSVTGAGLSHATLIYVDSPASTSALTYSVQLASDAGTHTATWGNSTTVVSTQVMILIEFL